MSSRFEDAIELTRSAANALALAARASTTDAEKAAAAEYLEITLEELTIASEELDARLAELDEVRRVTERERRRYEQFFQDAPGARVVTDRFGTIKDINRAGRALLGVPERHVRGKPLSAFVSGASRGEFRRRLHAAAAGSARVADPWMATVRRRDERPTTVSIEVQASPEEAGEDASYHWSLIPLVEAGDDRAEAPEGAAVAGRVAELEHQLATKDIVLSAIAHDLHGPLAVLSNLAETLSLHGSDVGISLEETSAVMRRQTASALRIIDDLLEVQREGVRRAAAEPVDVGEVVAEALDELEPSEHVLERDGWGTFPVSPVLLQRIVVNLVANAEKLAPRGTRIVVRHWSTAECLLIAVEDEGPGFATAEGSTRVFEPFSRLQRDVSLPGWGIGLSIVAELARLHGGSAWAVERTSGGASVQVLLRHPSTGAGD